jgi:hypothetical protein
MLTLPHVLRLDRVIARAASGFLFLLLGALIACVVATHGVSGWPVLLGVLAPDAALLLGIASGQAKGQLHPRAVPLYNALHRVAGPCVLAAAALLGLGLPWLVGALAWAAHIALDRSLGIGLRTPEGFIRG